MGQVFNKHGQRVPVLTGELRHYEGSVGCAAVRRRNISLGLVRPDGSSVRAALTSNELSVGTD